MKKIKLIDGSLLYIPAARINGVIVDNDTNRITVICGEQRLCVNMIDIDNKEEYVDKLFEIPCDKNAEK